MTRHAITERDVAFPPHVLQEYALVADGERGILVGPKGDFAWMCAPRWDSDGVFSSLIGGQGLYAVTPAEPRFVWGGYYEDGSLIWHSRWITTTGTVECREALAFPGDAHTAVILRRVVAIDGPTRVRVVLDARANFGQHKMGHLHAAGGVWTARTGQLRLRWSGAADAAPAQAGGLELLLELAPGTHHDLVLEMSDRTLAAPVQARQAWEATETAWKSAVPQLDGTLDAGGTRHSYAVLRGLTSAGGGMVAAATMALPERAGSGRSYDYRYAWIRDQCYAGQAIAAHGPHGLLDDAVTFVAERVAADGPDLKPAYTVTGGLVPDERSLPHLDGYPGGTDKVGNWVNQQFQLDTLGEALMLFAAAARHDHLDLDHWQAAEAAAKVIESRWNHPDAGIWELDNRHWAHSRLMCVAGLRAIAATQGATGSQGGTWMALADAIAADVASDSLHPSGRWQRAPDDERVDASLLLAAIRGAMPAGDPRSEATLEAVEAELASSGYLYRFRHDQRPLDQAEGAFVLCGFLMALATHQQGRTTEAVGWFERNRAACGPPGLFAEEFDVRQHQLRGNLPQAFVHALMFESATRLTRPWDTP